MNYWSTKWQWFFQTEKKNKFQFYFSPTEPLLSFQDWASKAIEIQTCCCMRWWGRGRNCMLSVPMLGFFSLDPPGVKAGSVLSSTGCEPSCALAHQDHWDLALCLCKEHSRAATLGFYRCEGFPPPLWILWKCPVEICARQGISWSLSFESDIFCAGGRAPAWYVCCSLRKLGI